MITYGDQRTFVALSTLLGQQAPAHFADAYAIITGGIGLYIIMVAARPGHNPGHQIHRLALGTRLIFETILKLQQILLLFRQTVNFTTTCQRQYSLLVKIDD